MIEYVDHLHEHFVEPARIGAAAATWRPARPGGGAQMRPESRRGVPLSRRSTVDERARPAVGR